MTSLLLDTSHHLHLRLFDEKFDWLDGILIEDTRSSSKIHQHLYQLLFKNSLKIEQIDKIIVSCGPGSYTGMRISHGIAEVLELLGKDVFSFYHFDIPQIFGVHTGYWIGRAFKGEYFVYHWQNNQIEYRLLSIEKFKSQLEKEKLFYCHSLTDEMQKELDIVDGVQFVSTQQMIIDKGQILLPHLLQNKKLMGPFYYRSIEQEFNRPNLGSIKFGEER